jgi:lysyl-tRNA synthetase class 1
VDEYDELKSIYLGTKNLENEKDREHARRLYEMVRRKSDIPVDVDYGFCAVVGQITANDEEALGILERTGHMRNPTPEKKELILERVKKARFWAQHHAPERLLFRIAEHVTDDVRARLTDVQKKALSSLHARLKSSWATGQELKEADVSAALIEEAKRAGLEPKQMYEASYLMLLGKTSGPKLAPFILALKEKALALLGEV